MNGVKNEARPEGRYIVPGLSQGLAVLSMFSRKRIRIAAPEIARELRLPRTTVFRILHTLQVMGFVCREDDERHFRLGPAVLGAGFAFIASLDVVEISQPVLQRLRDVTGWSAHMAIRDGADIVYVARFAAHATVRSSVNIGSRLPVHATVMGRALAWDMTLEDMRQLFGAEALPKFSEQTPATAEAFLALVNEDKARGYAFSQSFFERGVSSVAAPVRDSSGAIVAAVNVTSVDAYVDAQRMHAEIKDALMGAAGDITQWLTSDEGVQSQRKRVVV
ncbi:MAG: IclR family transcriptional regulator [Alphaproteobacteria bacterium]|nr:IclR family transcriptional regulator [Alphaproteobacteria bacterium]